MTDGDILEYIIVGLARLVATAIDKIASLFKKSNDDDNDDVIV
jgi:hypothetical protein